MKIITAGIVVIIVLAATLFVTPAYAPCIEGPGINCNNYPPPSLSQIKFNKLNYETSDKPLVTIMGAPDAVAHLEIDDSSSNIMYTHDINLAPNGTVIYALDISYYKPGVYSVIATSPISKLTTSFAVGLTTTGPIVTLNVAKNTYVQGDFITIAGTVGPDDAVQLSLIDPNDNVVTSIQTVSNNVGQYSTSALKIPTNAVSGTWKITADHNTSHTMLKILVQSSSSNDVMKNNIGIISPLKQFQSGIVAKDVKCKQGLQFIMKNENGQPACVTPRTFDGLITRGWGIVPLGGLPTSLNASSDISIGILYNGTVVSYDNPVKLKQGQNVTLILDVKSDPANVPVTLYTPPYSGFTKTNGIDFRLSDTRVIAPAKVMLYVSVSKDAIPSTYGGSVKGNSTDHGNTTYFLFITVK